MNDKLSPPDRSVRLNTFEQVSAGGVAYRKTDDTVEIAVILTNPEGRWQLPKGMIDAGETAEQAAVREVREEAGIETELGVPIDTTEYWFSADRQGKRTRFHKSVHWYLMKYVSGNVEDHDHEVLEARWMPAAAALEKLVFKNERDIVKKALEIIGSS
jgi:8-oxo-dGTP pyrophosphatase MutT (NUDIX family)